MLRSLLASISALALVALATSPALADEELFILDNGSVLRGEVVRETDASLTIAMSGVLGAADVTVERAAVVERHMVRSNARRSFVVETSEALEPRTEPLETPVDLTAPEHDPTDLEPLPRGDPPPEAETFLVRFVRLASVAVPDTPHARLTLGVFLVIILLILVSWGARLTDIPAPSLFNAGAMALLFAVLFCADFLLAEELLRADRALWVVTGEVAIWVGAARLLLGGTVARAVLLFTFILTSLLAVLFVTGAVFVTV